MIEYYVIAILAGAAALAFIANRHRWQASRTVGFISWIGLALYFPIEAVVTRATTSTYDFLRQPMSDLGVLSCDSHTYMLAPYYLCSPLAPLMNVTFIMTGIMVATGAVLLHRFWPDNRRTRAATALWVIHGLSYSISGIYPADVNFWAHTLPALPGMLVQIPAMIIIGAAIRQSRPRLAAWTYACLILSTLCLLLIIIGLVPGLLQRLLYGFVWLWMIGAAIALWRTDSILKRNAAVDGGLGRT